MSTTKTTTRKSSGKNESIENATKIVKRAIRNKTSLSEAARSFGKGRNYVSDVRSRISSNLKNKLVSPVQVKELNAAIKEFKGQSRKRSSRKVAR